MTSASSIHRIILLISSVLLSLFASAQTAQFTLTGTTAQASDGQVISGVEIYDEQSQQLVNSDANGNYTLVSLKPGQHTITVFADAYQLQTITLDLTQDQTYNFKLTPLSLDLDGIDIVAKREEFFAIKRLADIEGTSIFAGKKTEVVVIDKIKGNIANNNGRQVYAQVSGLNIYEGNDGGLQLNIGGRGLDPNRTSNFNTRQNGYDISADVLGYPESYYTPPTEAISEVRIIRGASSLQYGTQFGGLIDFRLRQLPSYKKLHLSTSQTISSWGGYSTHNSVGINKGAVSFNGFYNYKRGDGYRDNSDYNSHNAFGALEWRLTDKSKVKLEYTYLNYLAQQAGGLTDEQFEETPRLSTRNRNWFGVNWQLYNLRFSHKFNSQALLDISIFGLNASRKTVGFRGNPITLNQNPITDLDEQDASGNFISPRDVIDDQFRNYGAELKFLNNYSLGDKRATFLIGSKFFKSNNTSLQGPGSTGVDANFDILTEEFPDYPNQSQFTFPNTNLAVFGENIFYLSDKFSLIPGARFEYIRTVSEGSFNQVNFDLAGNPISNEILRDDRDLTRSFLLLGLGAKYQISDRLQFIANLSQNYRSVTFSDIRVVNPTFIVDPNIVDERGFTADMSIRGRLKNILSYDLTAFSVLYSDRIGIVLDDRANRVRTNIGTALISGTEIFFSSNLLRWWKPDQRQHKLSVFMNGAFTISEYLSSEENNVEGRQVEFIPTVNIKTGLTYEFKNFSASYQWTYLSSQFTDAQNSERAGSGDQRSGIIGPIPAYGISDLTFTYKWKQFSLNSGINNLLDNDYFTRRATGYPGPGIIPSDGRSFFVGLKYTFEK